MRVNVSDAVRNDANACVHRRDTACRQLRANAILCLGFPGFPRSQAVSRASTTTQEILETSRVARE